MKSNTTTFIIILLVLVGLIVLCFFMKRNRPSPPTPPPVNLPFEPVGCFYDGVNGERLLANVGSNYNLTYDVASCYQEAAAAGAKYFGLEFAQPNELGQCFYGDEPQYTTAGPVPLGPTPNGGCPSKDNSGFPMGQAYTLYLYKIK